MCTQEISTKYFVNKDVLVPKVDICSTNDIATSKDLYITDRQEACYLFIERVVIKVSLMYDG